MLDWVLDRHYAHLVAERAVQYTLTVVGAHESELVQLLQAITDAHPRVKVSSLPHFLADGGREIELGVRGSEESALAQLRTALETGGFMIKP